MKRSGALFAALIVLFVWISGCSGPTPEQRAIKDAFIRQLVGYLRGSRPAAGKDRREAQPGMSADQFALFVEQARANPRRISIESSSRSC